MEPTATVLEIVRNSLVEHMDVESADQDESDVDQEGHPVATGSWRSWREAAEWSVSGISASCFTPLFSFLMSEILLNEIIWPLTHGQGLGSFLTKCEWFLPFFLSASFH